MSETCKQGFLVLNKPVGERSTRCVEVVRRILGKKVKVGHGGTLDSTASGVLVVLVGAATRLSSVVMGLPKCYETTLKLGTETDTDDASGNVTRSAQWQNISTEDIDFALSEFSGWRLQTPPAVSAVHVDGKRAHELTRSGEDVVIAPKPVYFEKVLRKTDITADGRVSFEIRCQKGTYIRSFGRDLARVLKSAGHICALERKFVGCFDIKDSVDFSAAEKMQAQELYSKLVPLSMLEEILPAYRGDAESDAKLANGQNIAADSVHRLKSSLTANYFGSQALLESERHFALCDYVISDGKVYLHPSVNLQIDGV